MDQSISNQNEKKVCHCSHHKIVPWMIILIGVTSILYVTKILPYMQMGIILGILLIIIGGAKLVDCKCGCR